MNQRSVLPISNGLTSYPPVPRARIAVCVGVSILSGIGLLGKQDLIRGVLHLSPIHVAMLAAGSLAAPIFWPLAVRWSQTLAPLFLAGLAVTILLVYPHVVRMHSAGRGSDQADCVIVAGDQLLHAQWPYQRDKLWSHSEMSCGPGWVAVQAPLIVGITYRYALLAIWACVIFSLTRLIGWRQASAVIAVLCLSPGVWLSAADGTDFLTFGICIVSLAVALDRLKTPPFLLALLLGLIAQFRLPTVFLPLFMGKQPARRIVVTASIIACATFLAFLIWHPHAMIADGPVTVLQKFGMDQRLSRRPVLTSAALAGALAGGLYLCSQLSRRFNGSTVTLVYLLLAFGAPAFLDLILRLSRNGAVSLTLRDWNGGPWLVACIPLSAYLMVRDYLHHNQVAGH